MKILTNIKYEKFPEVTNILYFSPHGPDFDKSSGGNRLLQILKIIKLDLGYNVYFICNDGLDNKYIDELQKININTFALKQNNIEVSDYISQLKSKNIDFSHAIFSWYDIALQYMDITKSIYPDIKTIIDSVDVHWLREERGRDKQKIQMTDMTLIDRKVKEIKCYAEADVVFSITEKEKTEILEYVGSHKNIKILSNIHDGHQIKILGDHIVFIGGFGHTPNVSAAIETIKIYKEFRNTETFKKIKRGNGIVPKLYIVGPNPPKKIKQAKGHCSDIIITGKVEDLEEIHSKTRVSISPLLWGAGIKGKICDASIRSIPVLTSTIGNEGINFEHKKHAFIANSTKEFVDNLSHIYSMSDKNLYEIANSGKEHICKIVSKDAAFSTLIHTFKAKKIIISIVAYNNVNNIDNCLRSIFTKTKYPNYHIVITDNSENDNIKKYIEKVDKKYKSLITYNKNKKNEYFIGANNKVLSNEIYKDSDVVLINDDVVILSECWLTRLYSAAYSSPKIAAVGGKTIFPNGLLAEAGAELYNDGHGRNIGRNEDPNLPQYNIPKYVGYCSGCLLYMKREIIDKIGIFSKDLQLMYYDDSEWQYRAHIYGYKTLYEPKCIAIHNEGSSAGTDITKGMKRYQEINRKIFLEKYGNLNIEQFNS
jgi:GT2 family glycosyltransferase